MTITQNIGETIRLLRQKKRMSQEQLALQAGINTSYLGQVERGEKNPTIKTLEKIANALEISLSDLISNYSNQKGDRGSNQQFLALLTPEDIKKYLISILQDEIIDKTL